MSAKTGGVSQYALIVRRPPTTTPVLISPATLNVTGVEVNPTSARVGAKVTISATVTNTGGSAGEYDVALMVNGTREELRRVSLAPGGAAKIDFVVNKTVPGAYAVEVNGVPGSFTIEADPVATKLLTSSAEALPTQAQSAGAPLLAVGIALIAVGVLIASGLVHLIVRTRPR